MGERVVGFSEEGARRVVESTKWVEGTYRNPDLPQSSGIRTPQRFSYIALSPSGGIPAATGTPGSQITPGSGVVTLYLFDGTYLNLTTNTLTAWNMTTSAVGGSKLIQVIYIDGYWWVDVESC